MADKVLKSNSCGCKVLRIGGAGMSPDNANATLGIDYCPLHYSAPKLVKALEQIYEESHDPAIEKLAKQALALVEGKEENNG